MELEYSAGIVIYNSGRYLLLNYGRSRITENRWGLTKGRIEKNETVFQAALREAYEETGIKDISILEEFQHKITYYFNRGNKRIKKTVIYLIGISAVEDVKISKEHIGFQWASFSEALDLLTFENTRKVIRASERYLRENELAKTPNEV
ncbi:MAG: NUDIX domain-containing protein [Candidatus Heimdallarchaeota archaeon]|nr:NUDIX domain-containing protein [Candidatus Heimdallarchaeota archaeon]MCK4955739.1 NUDIX domain-containing protein [Candidatus Heimdallarchaeota archaeon]